MQPLDPYNQSTFQRIPAPYAPGPAQCFGITTLWMLSDFNVASGGTLVVPGSFKEPVNPTMPSAGAPGAATTGQISVQMSTILWAADPAWLLSFAAFRCTPFGQGWHRWNRTHARCR